MGIVEKLYNKHIKYSETGLREPCYEIGIKNMLNFLFHKLKCDDSRGGVLIRYIFGLFTILK